jgi:hypothetical protein
MVPAAASSLRAGIHQVRAASKEVVSNLAAQFKMPVVLSI